MKKYVSAKSSVRLGITETENKWLNAICLLDKWYYMSIVRREKHVST